MRIDDIFEAMTDIDDRFIEAARPLEPLHDGQPVTIVPAPRRARWKTIVPAAACVAAVLTTTAIGGKYLYTKSLSAASESKTFWYPEMGKYIVSEKITNNTEKLTYAFTTSGAHYERWDDESYYAKDFDELAAKSDLIVAGQFVDLPHQAQDPKKIHVSGHDSVRVGNGIVIDETDITGPMEDACMFNYLRVGRVLKGDVKADDYLLINQETSVNTNGNDYYIVFAYDRLTPMLKGDEWIYFLQETEDGYYIPVNGAQGRYPMPNNNNVDFSEADGKIDEFSTYSNAAPARDEIYAELLSRLNRADKPKIEQISVPGESFNTFAVEEFPDVEFNVSRLGVSANDADVFHMKDDETLENLYLADLNGDGKRELCATIGGENSAVVQKRVAVRDYANDLYYTLGNELDCSLYGENLYFLSIDTGTVYTNSDVNNEPVWIPEDNEVLVVRYTVRESADAHLIVKTQELTLDMMKLDDTSLPLWEVPLWGNATFTLPDFVGFRFETIRYEDSTAFLINDDTHSGVVLKKQVEAVYFCDLNGDGQREIILSEVEDEGCGVWVYDIMDDGELGCARYPAEGYGRAVELNGKLALQTDSGTKEINYSKSDLQRVVTDRRSMWGGTPFKLGDSTDYGYYNIKLDIDHKTTTFNDFFPNDDISIENGTLRISRNSETLLKTGRLEELYGVTDAENDCLLFVYKNESGGIDAFMLTENDSKLVHIDDLVDNNVELTDHRDVSIDFKDGRGVSLIRVLSLIYK